MNPYIIYHADCTDGFGAAYCAWRNYGDDAEYISVYPGQALPSFEPDAPLVFLDVCPKRDVLVELAKRHDILIIDHHKTAQADLAGIEDECPSIISVFDMDHSAAYLAWQWFAPRSSPAPEIPKLIRNIEDRDLWKFERPNTRAIIAALLTYPMEFDVWAALMQDDIPYRTLAMQGRAILANEAKQIELLLKEVRAAYVSGYVFPVVNAPHFFASELGNALLERFPNAPFAATYRDSGDGRRYWSFRSSDRRQDVSFICRMFGGGGHRNAAGMTEEVIGQTIAFVEGRYHA